MPARLFGTDGLRGVANEDLSVEVVTNLGRAAATVLGQGHGRPVFVVGGDTRASTDLLTAALTAGLCSAGADVVPVGVLPTAGVAYCTTVSNAHAGAVISASHNPAPDNGVKFFGSVGYKLPESVEDAIQACYEARSWSGSSGPAIGRIRPIAGLADRYTEHLLVSCPASLDGLHVVIDCAHGAGYEIAPAVFRAAGAQVDVVCAEPDGNNINAGCGATHTEMLCEEVVVRGADLGLALDGDADRVLAADAKGGLVDGDVILAITALDRHSRGVLKGDGVVVTVMSNLGLLRALERAGVTAHTCQVGDRYVLEALQREGLEVGGEQSGHTLFLDLSTAGDGILTGMQLCAVVARTGLSLAELAAVVEPYPQVLLNVAVSDKRAAMADEQLTRAVAEAELRLGGDGRVLVRPSGTENLVRVMVEAADESTAREIAESLKLVVEQVAGVR